jgi:hypothetical protein
MIFPKLMSLTSPDLVEPKLPTNPEHFSVALEALIGPSSSGASDIFSFTAASPSFLAEQRLTTWGRGLLVVSKFSWPTIHSAVERLLIRCVRATWPEVAGEINKVLLWQFDNYLQRNA